MYFVTDIVTENPLPPVLRYSECPVCYEELSSSDKTFPIVLNCNHIFCITCTRGILDKRAIVTCPLCRGQTLMKTIYLFNGHDMTTCIDYLIYISFLLVFLYLICVILPSELTRHVDSELEKLSQKILLGIFPVFVFFGTWFFILPLSMIIYNFLRSGLLLIKFILLNIQNIGFSF